MQKTLSTNNPYASIKDIAEEGIETRFVVSAVAFVLSSVFDAGRPEEGIPRLITEALEVGGDPDTICSIALSLYGLRWPEQSKTVLDELEIGRVEV